MIRDHVSVREDVPQVPSVNHPSGTPQVHVSNCFLFAFPNLRLDLCQKRPLWQH